MKYRGSVIRVHSATARASLQVDRLGVLVLTVVVAGVVVGRHTRQCVQRVIAQAPRADAYLVRFDKALLATALPVMDGLTRPVVYVATEEQRDLSSRLLEAQEAGAMPLVFSPQQIAAARRWLALSAAA